MKNNELREDLLKAVEKIMTICSSNEKCENCLFYDETDKYDMCRIKTEDAPHQWSVRI